MLKKMSWGLVLCSAACALAEEPRLFRLDPVELISGREVEGKPELELTEEGFNYRFISEQNKAAFLKEPARHRIQMDGACTRMGPLGTFGNPEIWRVYQGKLYIFRAPECRETFERSPSSFLPEPETPPNRDPDAQAEARRLMARAVEAAGGAERLAKLSAWKLTASGESTHSGKLQKRTRTWLFTAKGQYRFDDVWEGWRGTWVLDGEHGYIDEDYKRPLYAAGRAEFRLVVARQYLSILLASTRLNFDAWVDGEERVDGQVVKLIKVAHDGVTTTAGVDADSGRLVSVGYRELGTWGGAYRRDDVYRDFRDVGGLTLPFERRTSVNGEFAASRSVALTKIELDPVVESEVFRAP